LPSPRSLDHVPPWFTFSWVFVTSSPVQWFALRICKVSNGSVAFHVDAGLPSRAPRLQFLSLILDRLTTCFYSALRISAPFSHQPTSFSPRGFLVSRMAVGNPRLGLVFLSALGFFSLRSIFRYCPSPWCWIFVWDTAVSVELPSRPFFFPSSLRKTPRLFQSYFF